MSYVQSRGVEPFELTATRPRKPRSRGPWFETLSLVGTVACVVPIATALTACNVYDVTPDAVPETREAATTEDAQRDTNRDDTDAVTTIDGAGGASDVRSGDRDGRGGTGGVDGSGTGGVDGSGTGGSDGSGDAVGRGGSGASAGGDGAGGSGGQGGAAGSGGAPPDGSRDSGTAGTGVCDWDAADGACFDGSIDSADTGIVDRCPNDPLKTEPGICGCGTPDTDSDMDNTADCVDGCPTDPKKTQPLVCGCNADESSDPDAGLAFCIKALLVHRYSFNGTGTVASDSIGTAHGAIMGGANATMSGGSVNLTGDLGARYTSEGYVSLPANLLDPLTSVTVEAWVTWRGAGGSGSQVWQRIFDFGNQVASGSELIGSTYLFLTPRTASNGFLRTAFSANGSGNETVVNAPVALPMNVQTHVAVVVDDPGNTIALYLNGAAQGSVMWTGTLAAINDAHSWLGRSNYGVDPEFNGILHEFRIFRAPLSDAQLRASYLAGPDPPFF
jgi:hypothetical protein